MWNAVQVTSIFTVASVILSVGMALGLALLLAPLSSVFEELHQRFLESVHCLDCFLGLLGLLRPRPAVLGVREFARVSPLASALPVLTAGLTAVPGVALSFAFVGATAATGTVSCPMAPATALGASVFIQLVRFAFPAALRDGRSVHRSRHHRGSRHRAPHVQDLSAKLDPSLQHVGPHQQVSSQSAV